MEKFPWGYYLLWSAVGAIGAGAVIALGRLVANIQVFGSTVESGAFYAGYACGTAITVFVGCMIAFYLVFKSAKNRRQKMEAELEFDLED